MSGGKYLLGDYDQDRDKFKVTKAATSISGRQHRRACTRHPPRRTAKGA